MIEVFLCSSRTRGLTLLSAAALAGPSLFSLQQAVAQSSDVQAPSLFDHQGEPLPTSAISPTISEGLDAVLQREARAASTPFDHRARNGAQGEWMIASLKRHGQARSGQHYATNKWGDTNMGIGFGREVDVLGAWFLEQYDASLAPATLVAVGYREGVEVARSQVFTSFGLEPVWFQMGLGRVDRIELVAEPKAGDRAQYGMDDLTIVIDGAEVVFTFEEANYQERLTGSSYGGLNWEVGTGAIGQDVVHAPLRQDDDGLELREDEHLTLGGGGTSPTLLSSIRGPASNDGSSGANYIPPDTCGAVGPNHFVAVVNANLSVYNKTTGARVLNTSLQSFLAGDSFGDPRATYDKISGRFIILATDFNNEISLAISDTSDPTGTWKKAAFNPGTGTDAGKWPDYPTLGVNKDFIVTCAYMVGGSNNMSIFAIDKANFMNTGALTVTAFRNVPWEGAIHPATTWDNSASQYLVSRQSGGLRIRRLNLPANAPTLSELGSASVSTGSFPPCATQQGAPSLDSLDARLMNSWWINGHIWTTNCIGSGGRAAVRWYQVNTSTITTVQSGTIADPTFHYIDPSIAVNEDGDVGLGFTGTHSGTLPGTFLTGRRATDPAGEMAIPQLYKAGDAAYNGGTCARWGDYSLTSLDPNDGKTFWTIQEYSRTGNNWGTYIAEFGYEGACVFTNYCLSAGNSVGPGSLISYAGSGSVAANDFAVFTSGNPANQNGVFFMGPNQTLTSFGNGFLCVSGALTRYPVVPADSFGIAYFNVDNTVPPALGKIVSGSTWNWQYWYRDPMGGGSLFNLSDGLSVTYCP